MVFFGGGVGEGGKYLGDKYFVSCVVLCCEDLGVVWGGLGGDVVVLCCGLEVLCGVVLCCSGGVLCGCGGGDVVMWW